MRISDAIHAELMNWSRFCWLGEWPHPLPASRCASLEGHYQAPPDWNPDDPPPAPTIRPNEKHARIVQAAWEQMPRDERMVLRAEYPARHQSGRVEGIQVAAARMGLSVRHYEIALAAAIRRVEGVFDAVRP